MKYLLDTSTCVSVLRGEARVVDRVSAVAASDIGVSIVTVVELWFGVRTSVEREVRAFGVRSLLAPFEVLPFDELVVEPYVESRYRLAAAGTPIGERDLIIAATGLAHGLTVVTHNVRKLHRVPGLVVEEWG